MMLEDNECNFCEEIISTYLSEEENAKTMGTGII